MCRKSRHSPNFADEIGERYGEISIGVVKILANVTTLRSTYGMSRPSVVRLSSVCDIIPP